MKESIKKILNFIYKHLFIITCITWIISIKVITYLNLTYQIYLNNFDLIYLIIIPIFIFTYIRNLIKEKDNITIIDLLIYSLIILCIISVKHALDIHIALSGNARGTGAYLLISWALMFLNIMHIKSDKKHKILLITTLIIGFIELIYAFLQIFTTTKYINYFIWSNMANALSINPNFFGAFMTFLTVFCITYYIFIDNKYHILGLIGSVLFTYGLVLSSSSAPFMSVGFVLIILLIYLIIKKPSKILRYILITFIVTTNFLLFNRYTMNYYHSKGLIMEEAYTIDNGLNQIKKYTTYLLNKIIPQNKNQIETGKIENIKDLANEGITNIGSGRIWLWNKSLPLLLKYPIYGCGPDNFELAIGQIDPNSRYVEAHNVYLNFAINNGIPSLLIYLCITCSILIMGIKSKKPITIILTFTALSYLVQAFFTISLMQVTTYFYIIAGILASTIIKEKKEISSK